jgi:hypothetical protein
VKRLNGYPQVATEQDGNKDVVVDKQVGFYRTVLVPALASSLRRSSDPQICRAFGDRLERGLKTRLMPEPAPINSLVETIVFRKD